MTKFCPNCGKKSDANAKFCPYCGQNLTHKKETSQSSISLPTRSSKSRTHDSKRWWILLVKMVDSISFSNYFSYWWSIYI